MATISNPNNGKTENIEDAVQILEYAVNARGRVLSSVIILESSINLFLASYFCKDERKVKSILEMVFATTKITFDNKRDILIGILNQHDKPFLVKHKHFSKDLQRIAEERNIFAHHEVDITSREAVKNFKENMTIQFHKYKNAKLPEPYSPQQLDDLMERISFYSHLIAKYQH